MDAISYVECGTVKEKYVEVEDVLTEKYKKIFFGKNNCWFRTFGKIL